MPTTPRRRRAAALVVGSLAALLLGACSPARADPPPPARPTAAVPEPARTATLAFAGDVHLEGVSAGTADLGGAFSVLRDADVSVVDLETAVTGRGEPAAKRYAFRAPPAATDALASAGVDAVTVANNHGMDHGRAGLADTVAAGRAAGLGVLGAGPDRAAALAPWRTAPHGVRVSVLAATDVLDTSLATSWTATPTAPGLASAKDERHLLEAVRAERPRADVLVVFLHWGVERQVCPTDRQEHLARELAAAGADVVVGSHAHVLQPSAEVDGALVAYGPGSTSTPPPSRSSAPGCSPSRSRATACSATPGTRPPSSAVAPSRPPPPAPTSWTGSARPPRGNRSRPSAEPAVL